VALSTGGTAIMLRGRVGDVPIFGPGLFAGAHGAAAATGTGERIVEKLLAFPSTLAGAGMRPRRRPSARFSLITAPAHTGIIVVTPSELGAAADRSMAWAGREDPGDWVGP
jgi:isoaspartyl peptidase/L-asparaginase-like protein (Ntn-hydrolase superfamily)